MDGCIRISTDKCIIGDALNSAHDNNKQNRKSSREEREREKNSHETQTHTCTHTHTLSNNRYYLSVNPAINVNDK